MTVKVQELNCWIFIDIFWLFLRTQQFLQASPWSRSQLCLPPVQAQQRDPSRLRNTRRKEGLSDFFPLLYFALTPILRRHLYSLKFILIIILCNIVNIVKWNWTSLIFTVMVISLRLKSCLLVNYWDYLKCDFILCIQKSCLIKPWIAYSVATLWVFLQQHQINLETTFFV